MAKLIWNEYLVYLQVLVETRQEGINVFNSWSMIIRKVHASSEDEAIGKFLRATSDIPRKESILPVTCFPLKNLAEIK